MAPSTLALCILGAFICYAILHLIGLALGAAVIALPSPPVMP